MDKYHGEITEVYYKLYLNKKDLVTIVCMQDFDEYDYHQERFIRNSEGKAHRFETEEMALEKMKEWYKLEEIDEEYREEIKIKNLTSLLTRDE